MIGSENPSIVWKKEAENKSNYSLMEDMTCFVISFFPITYDSFSIKSQSRKVLKA